LLCMQRALAKQDYVPAFSTYLLEQLRIPAKRIFLTRGKPMGW
jgi:hemoglobin